jgi:IclR family transcriptional regulator, acetate operon repressor
VTFVSAELGSMEQVQSIKRAFELLELMAESEGELTVSELASRSGLAATTVHRMLQTLVVDGYVRQEASRAYALGPRLIHLGGTASRRLGSWARPFMARVAEATGETVNLAVLEADEVVYIAQIPSRHNLRMFTEIGRRLPPHCTAAGKALLGQRSDPDVLTTLRRVKMTAFTPRTITDEDDFIQHLEFVRQQGYAVEDGEHEAGVRSLAVPVLGAPRNMAIAVSAPEARLSTTDAARLVPMMRDAVSDLVRSLNPARDGSVSDTDTIRP